MSLHTRIRAACQCAGDRPFLTLIGGDSSFRQYTYAGVLEHAGRWLTLFQSRGLQPRARVVIAVRHSLDTYAAYLGALLGGFVPAMFAFPSPKLSSSEYLRTLGTLLEATRPAAFVADRELLADVSAVLANHGVHAVEQAEAQAHAPASAWHEASAVCASDVAFLQYSSGTTGLKKGVAITHGALLWQIERYAAAIDLVPDDVIVSWLPLYHDMGLLCCFFLPLLTGTPLVAMSPFDWVARPAMLLRAMSDFQGTLCWLPNFAFSHIAKHTSPAELAGLNLSSVRGLINCSEPISAQSHDVLVDRLASCELRPDAPAVCYAMAENTFAVTAAGCGTPVATDVVDRECLARGRATPAAGAGRAARLVSSGRPLDDTVVEIVSETGARLAEREVGEIAIWSPSLFEGYLGHGAIARTPDGRFLTGDVGYLADGQLYVIARKKDTIIVAGKNVFPEDIEAAVSDVSGLIPGRVVALGIPDTALGTERIVVVAETVAGDEVVRQRICADIRRLAGEVADVSIDDVCLVEPRWLHKSSSGKLARAENRRRYLAIREGQRADSVAPPAAVQAGATVVSDWVGLAIASVRRVLGAGSRRDVPDIERETRLLTSGLIDSLAVVALVVDLEQAAGLHIPPASLDIGHFETPARIAHLLAELHGRKAGHERIQEDNHVVQMDDRDKVCQRFPADGDIDLLILGSSRAQHFDPAIATGYGHRAFNAWLRNARAEDLYCQLRYVLDHGGRSLTSVLLSLDVEAFSNAADPDLRLVHSRLLRPYFDEAGLRCPAGAAPGQALDRFASVSVQFKVGAVETWMFGEHAQPVTDRTDPGAGGRRARPFMPLADAHDRDAQYTMRMAGFTALDPNRVRNLHGLLHLCFERGIRVVAFVSPLHPVLDRVLSTTTTYADRLEDLCLTCRAIDHPLLTFHDTRTPDRFGGIEDDFVNAAHIGMLNSDRLFEFLLRETSARRSRARAAAIAVSALAPSPPVWAGLDRQAGDGGGAVRGGRPG